jgi:hypothetical protein
MFWLLQDSLNRLIDNVDRERSEVCQSRTVIRKVALALESRHVQKLSTIPGIKKACEKINSSLMRLERTTQQARAAGAGS